MREDDESGDWSYESSQHDHQHGSQKGNQEPGNVRRAGDAKGSERVRRIETGRMPIIEELDEDEDFVDLVALFGGYDEEASVRMVKMKMIPVCDMSMGEEEDYEKDELHWWYEATKSQQEWIEKLVEIPITGHAEGLVIEERQQEWKEKLVEIPITGPIIEECDEDRVRMVNAWDEGVIEVVLKVIILRPWGPPNVPR